MRIVHSIWDTGGLTGIWMHQWQLDQPVAGHIAAPTTVEQPITSEPTLIHCHNRQLCCRPIQPGISCECILSMSFELSLQCSRRSTARRRNLARCGECIVRLEHAFIANQLFAKFFIADRSTISIAIDAGLSSAPLSLAPSARPASSIRQGECCSFESAVKCTASSTFHLWRCQLFQPLRPPSGTHHSIGFAQPPCPRRCCCLFHRPVMHRAPSTLPSATSTAANFARVRSTYASNTR